MQLILLAAGRGSRLPKNFRNQPKCLVKLNNKTILEHNKNFFDKFKKKIIVTGYKRTKLKKFIKNNNFNEVFNSEYKNTNMVHSMFLAKNKIKEDLVICYGDVIFNENILEIFKRKVNIMPVNINWLKLWQLRMSKKKIIKDAENIEIKDMKLRSIGGKIEKGYPDAQYMGIIKVTYKSYLNMYKFFQKNLDPKIDMTNFLNLCLKKKILNINCKNYKSWWFEIDNGKDIKVSSKLIKKTRK